MIVEIKGVQFVNKGAELMLIAVLQQLELNLPNALIALSPGPNSPFIDRAQIGALQKLSIRKNRLDFNALTYYLPRRLRDWLQQNWGIVTEADIDVILDASGFAYGDQWGSIQILHLANEIKRFHKRGKKYIFLPQAFGPFSRKKDMTWLSDSLPSASLIITREANSKRKIESIAGSRSNILQYPDFTNLIVSAEQIRSNDLQNKVLVIPNSNMVSAKNVNKDWQESYVPILVFIINDLLERGITPVLLNHEGGGDAKICNLLKQKFKSDIDAVELRDPLEVKSAIGMSRGVICSRFHGCVSALSQQVPCLGTSWSHKYEELFEEYEVSDYLISPQDSESELKRKLSDLLDGTAKADLHIVDNFKALSEAMWRKVFEIMG